MTGEISLGTKMTSESVESERWRIGGVGELKRCWDGGLERWWCFGHGDRWRCLERKKKWSQLGLYDPAKLFPARIKLDWLVSCRCVGPCRCRFDWNIRWILPWASDSRSRFPFLPAAVLRLFFLIVVFSSRSLAAVRWFWDEDHITRLCYFRMHAAHRVL